LSHLLEQFDQNIIFALAAYNAGPHRVESWKVIRKDLEPLEFMESIPFFETRAYVKKVLRNYAIYLALYQGKAPTFLKEILTISSH
jgi:soluble lytic murein transglycosylase